MKVTMITPSIKMYSLEVSNKFERNRLTDIQIQTNVNLYCLILVVMIVTFIQRSQDYDKARTSSIILL